MANVTINMNEEELKELLESKGIEYDTISDFSGITLYKEYLESAIDMYELNRKYKCLFKNKRDKTVKNRIDKMYKKGYEYCSDAYIDIMDDADMVIYDILPEE